MYELSPCPFCKEKPWVFPQNPSVEGDAWGKVAWFSCGAASAVAAKVAVEAYSSKYEVVVMNVSIKNEHKDNRRFLRDVEKWIGRKIKIVASRK